MCCEGMWALLERLRLYKISSDIEYYVLVIRLEEDLGDIVKDFVCPQM